MSVERIPHKLVVKLYKKMLDRKHEVDNRIESLEAIDKNGFMASCCNINADDSKNKRHSILRFLNDPSRETWNDIYQVPVTEGKTFWKVWTAYDATAPKEIPACESIVRRWPSFPDPDKLVEQVVSELKSERVTLSVERARINSTLRAMDDAYPILQRKCQSFRCEQHEKRCDL